MKKSEIEADVLKIITKLENDCIKDGELQAIKKIYSWTGFKEPENEVDSQWYLDQIHVFMKGS